MKRLFVCIVALACALCAGAVALADVYAVVTDTNALNVRTGPASTFQWLGSVQRGGWVRVLSESGNWYRVELLDSAITGYMSKSYLRTAQGGQAGGGSQAVVSNPKSTQFLNLRAAPSYNAEVLGIFYNGTVCTILSEYDGWCGVRLTSSGVTMQGYFRGEYLSRVGGGGAMAAYHVQTGNTGKLNFRAAPSYQGDVLAKLPNGTQVSVMLQGAPFWQVMYNGIVGFVDSAYLAQGAGTGGGGGGGTGITGNAVVQTGNTGKLNLRNQANATARILGQYPNGTPLTVLQQGSAWCYVQVNTDGQKGYMMTRYLNILTTAASTKRVHNANGGAYVNLRTAPAKTSGNVSVRVPEGATVTILAWGDEWSQVSYNGITGYMMSWFLI